MKQSHPLVMFNTLVALEMERKGVWQGIKITIDGKHFHEAINNATETFTVLESRLRNPENTL